MPACKGPVESTLGWAMINDGLSAPPGPYLSVSRRFCCPGAPQRFLLPEIPCAALGRDRVAERGDRQVQLLVNLRNVTTLRLVATSLNRL